MASSKKHMLSRGLFVLLKWAATLGLIGGLLYVAFRVNAAMQAEIAREASGDKVQSPRRSEAGVVRIGADTAARFNFEVEPARSVTWTDRVQIYGRVIQNPRSTFEVRAPFAGTLRTASEHAWPVPGRWVRSGQFLGWMDIRVGTQERLSLQDNLNTARLKREGTERVAKLQRERVNRIERVSQSQIVPGQQLDDARVLLAEAETQLAIATAAVELWQQALADADKPGGKASTFSQPLSAPADGEVTDVAAQPGMAIEAGALIAQLVDFRHPLVRLDFPPSVLVAGPPPRVNLSAIPANPPALIGVTAPPENAEAKDSKEAVLVGPAPRLDEASQFVGYWYSVEFSSVPGASEATGPAARGNGHQSALWRPGLMVQAYVNSPLAEAHQAVSVPASSVLFHLGRPLVYVRLNLGEYERREVRLLAREGDRSLVAPIEDTVHAGIAPGDIVVRHGAQVLLSEEFRSDVAAE